MREGVTANLDRVNDKLRSEQAIVAALQTRFNAVQGEQRQYLTLVKSFQEACAQEAVLRERLEQLRRE